MDVTFDAEQRAVSRGRDEQIVGVVARVNGREQMLAAIFDPAHRMLELERQRRDGDVFRHQPVLAAEPAADVGRDHANLALGQTKRFGQPEPLDVTALGRKIDHELVVSMIPISQYAATFERHRGLTVHPELTAQADRRGIERLRRAFFDNAGDIGVVGPALEHAWAVRAHRRDAIDDGGQLFELKRDLVGEILGLGTRRRDASSDGLAGVADSLIGQCRIWAVAVGGKFRPGLEDGQWRQVGQREHVVRVGGRLDHPLHARVRHRAAHEGHVLDAGNPHVGNEHAVAEEMPGILFSQQTRTDPAVRR